MLTILRRKLDRLRLYRTYSAFPETQEFMSALFGLEKMAAAGEMEKKPGKHCTRYSKRIGSGVNRTSVAIKLFPVKGSASIAIECTPSKLEPSEWADFREMLDKLLAGGASEVVSHFTLSRVEIAMDVKIPFGEAVCIAPGMVTENLKYLADGTRYLGQKGAKRTFCIYDKRKQLADRVAVDLGHDLTRIEVRLRHLGKSLAEMAGIERPFGNLLVLRMSALNKLHQSHPEDVVLDTFVSAVGNGGSAQEAYLKLSKHYRKHLLGLLAPHSLPLNGKADFWGDWIQKKSKLLVSNFAK